MSRFWSWSLLLLALQAVACAGDENAWNNLGSLRQGDRIRVSLATGKPMAGLFESWTPQRLAFQTDGRGRVEANREDVRRIDRFRPRTWTRKKTALVGAGIGCAGGFALGVAAGGCHPGELCIVSRPVVGGFFGGLGLLVGAGVGAALPHHRTDMLYQHQ
jgi:hypothetical protein